jgi:hypothetical protein
VDKFNGATAVFPPEKIRDYLLSPTHPIGRYKSIFFRSLGYTQGQWEILERDLRGLLGEPAQPLDVTEYGQKYAIYGQLKGPNGRTASITCIWIILADEVLPRFVTAYPKD